MFTFLSKINKHLGIAIPSAMIFGFLWGISLPSAWLKMFIVPMTFVMIFPMMVSLRFSSIFNYDDIGIQAATQIVNFIVIPVIALYIGKIFFIHEPYFALGLFVASLLPTSGMTISWTGFAHGKVESAVKMTVIGLTLGSIAAPFYINIFMSQSIEFDIVKIIVQIIYILSSCQCLLVR